MRSILKNILIWFLGSVLVLYLAAGTMLWRWGNGRTAFMRGLVRMSNMGWDTYALRLARGETVADRAGLRGAIRYYKTLAGFIPSESQAYDMMGFCYFHLNDRTRSMRSYEKAVKLSPQFLWHGYNLGVIYYREGFLDKALACFLRILDVPIDEIPRRGIYAPLAKLEPEARRKFLQKGQAFAVQVREQAWAMAVRTYLMMKKNDEARVLAEKALQDPLVTNKKMFFLYAQAISQGRQDLLDSIFKSDLSGEDKRPILHPWVYEIPVGKERYF